MLCNVMEVCIDPARRWEWNTNRVNRINVAVTLGRGGVSGLSLAVWRLIACFGYSLAPTWTVSICLSLCLVLVFLAFSPFFLRVLTHSPSSTDKHRFDNVPFVANVLCSFTH